MAAPFEDHFSRRAKGYARYRPQYPLELCAFLARLPAQRERAWDCGTGSGQAAVGLAAFFERVIATDPSRRQIAHRLPHDRVRYAVARAEAAALRPASVDLVTAAQAVHWFDVHAFNAEVRRVARAGAAVAVWGYSLCTVNRQVDAVLRQFYEETVAPYWPPARRWVDEAYRTLPFPFTELEAPAFATRAQWTLDRILGYLGTWSAVERFREREGTDPVDALAPALRSAWQGDAQRRTVTWPLHLRVGLVE